MEVIVSASNMSPSALPVTGGWQKRFFTIWGGQALSLLGSSVVQFALIWWLTVTTNSGSILAIATLMGLLPQVLLGPLAGTLVDRYNRRRVMIAADGLAALASLILTLLFVTGQIQVWHVLAILFIRSLLGAFHQAAMQASTSLMVPQQQLTRIAGLNGTLFGVINIVSPIIGALLLARLAIDAIVMLDVVSALPAILPLLFINIPEPESGHTVGTAPTQGKTFWGEFGEGLRYVRGWPGLLMIIGMGVIINLVIVPAMALLPLLVKRQFGGEADQLASIQTLFGIGLIAGGILLGVWGGSKRRILTVQFGLTMLGIATFMIGMAGSIGLALAGMFLVGVAATLVNGNIQAIMQATVEPAMQGRVFSLTASAVAAMSPVGLLIAGPSADTFGTQGWYLAGGAICVICGLLGLLIPALMNIEQNAGHNEQTATDEQQQAKSGQELATEN